MLYLLAFNYNQAQYDVSLVHQVITEHLSLDDWWHYLPNVYIISTTVPVAGLSQTINAIFPGLLHFISKIDLEHTSGLLPKEAWEWINTKNANKGKIKVISRATLPLINPQRVKVSSKILDDILKIK